MKYFC